LTVSSKTLPDRTGRSRASLADSSFISVTIVATLVPSLANAPGNT
jgi:hypothetical protein